MKNTRNNENLENILNWIGKIGVIAGVIAGALSYATDTKVAPEAVSFTLIIGVLLYSIYAYLRSKRNAPFPFPRTFWQIVFNRSGASAGVLLKKIRIAVLAAPDGFEFTRELADSDSKESFVVELANNKEADPQAYSSDKIIIDLENSKEKERSKFEYLLENVHGVLLVWTDTWLLYPWAIEVIGRWAENNPEHPFTVIQMEESTLPESLEWANYDLVGNDQKKYLNSNTPTGLLLRQAGSRRENIQKHTENLWTSILLLLFSAVILLCFASYMYLNLKGDLDASEEKLSVVEGLFDKRSASSTSAIDDLSLSGATIREMSEYYLTTNRIDSAYVRGKIVEAMKTYENGMEKQLNRNFDFYSNDVKVDVFFLKEENLGRTCLCETNDLTIKKISCFDLENSVVSCSYNQNWIVHWGQIGDSTFVKAWNLEGEEISTDDTKLCSYTPDSRAEEQKRVGPKYNEIVCFPISTVDQDQYMHGSSRVNVCISLSEYQGILDDKQIHNKMLLSASILHTIPWGLYSDITDDIECDK